MSTQTTNLHLVKPAGNELVDVDVINDNMDIIDSAVAGKVNKSGDTITNINISNLLKLQSSIMDRDGTNPSDMVNAPYLVFRDKDDETVGYIQLRRQTDGRDDMFLCAQNEKTDGNVVENYFRLGIAKDGTCSYYISDQNAFKRSIQAVDSYHKTKSGSNLNNMQNGEMWWGNNLVNAPITGSGNYFEVIMLGMYQLAFYFTGNTTRPLMYLRSYVNGVWQPWSRIDSEPETKTLNKASGFDNGELKLTKVGHVVHVSAWFYHSANVSSGSNLFETIPEGWRPSSDTTIGATITNESGSGGWKLKIYTNGTVRQNYTNVLRSLSAAGQYIV